MSNVNIFMRDGATIPYRPEVGKALKDAEAAILLTQIVYWWGKNDKKPFYKFILPCEHELYRAGDSWTEELGFTRYKFGRIIKILLSRELIKTRLDRLSHLTYYDVDEEKLNAFLNKVYGENAMPKPDFPKAENQRSGTLKTSSRESWKPAPVYTEDYLQKTTTVEDSTAVAYTASEEPTALDEICIQLRITAYKPNKTQLLGFIDTVGAIHYDKKYIPSAIRFFNAATLPVRKQMLLNIMASKKSHFARWNETKTETVCEPCLQIQDIKKHMDIFNVDNFISPMSDLVPEHLREFTSKAKFKQVVELVAKARPNWKPLQADFINYQKRVMELGWDTVRRALFNTFGITEHAEETKYYGEVSPSLFFASVKTIRDAAEDKRLNARKFPTLEQERKNQIIEQNKQ